MIIDICYWYRWCNGYRSRPGSVVTGISSDRYIIGSRRGVLTFKSQCLLIGWSVLKFLSISLSITKRNSYILSLEVPKVANSNSDGISNLIGASRNIDSNSRCWDYTKVVLIRRVTIELSLGTCKNGNDTIRFGGQLRGGICTSKYNAFSKWQTFIGLSFLPENMRQNFIEIIAGRLRMLE